MGHITESMMNPQESMDLVTSIASAIYLSTRAHYVRIYACREMDGEAIAMIAAQVDGSGLFSAQDTQDNEAAAGAELLENNPMLLRVVNSHTPLHWQESGNGLYLSCYPILIDGKVRGLVELKEKHAPYHDEDATVSHFVSLYINYQNMQARLGNDPKTGLMAASALRADLAAHHAQATTDAPRWLALLEIDHLQDIRNLYGQLFADELVRHTASELQLRFGLPDRGYILERDRFAILLSAHGKQNVPQRLDTWRDDYSRSERINIGAATLSIGLCSLASAKNANEALARAEYALRLAQADGYNRLCEPAVC